MATSSAITATFCSTLVDEWIVCGVRHAVVAPGSRSTPMALALAERSELGLHVFHDERSAGFAALGILYRPFQLDPTAPLDTPTPVRDVYIKKFGGVERADEILAHVTKIAAVDGIEFHMDRALRANTSRAHRLIALAQK